MKVKADFIEDFFPRGNPCYLRVKNKWDPETKEEKKYGFKVDLP
jgi:hypothetical protein